MAIVGNPLSATYMDGTTAEVLRLCVEPDSPKGACSFLYAACWRAWRAMGGQRLITYTLIRESGSSLRGAGWRVVGEVAPHNRWSARQDHLRRAKRLFHPTGLFRLLDDTPDGYRRTFIAEGNLIYNRLAYGPTKAILMVRASFKRAGRVSPI